MMVAHMALPTRRQFLQTGAAVSACALMATHQGLASPFGLPLGLELYSVRDELPKDYAGTLKKVAALGYREVEAAGYYGHSAGGGEGGDGGRGAALRQRALLDGRALEDARRDHRLPQGAGRGVHRLLLSGPQEPAGEGRRAHASRSRTGTGMRSSSTAWARR